MSPRLGARRFRLRACTNDLEVIIRAPLLIVAVLAAITIMPSAKAAHYPKRVPKHWHAPRAWLPGAMCIHRREGAFNAATGNGYEGGFQFLRSTWLSVGGPTYGYHWASLASPKEQLYRAWLVWLRDGRSWREWGTASACGLP